MDFEEPTLGCGERVWPQMQRSRPKYNRGTRQLVIPSGADLKPSWPWTPVTVLTDFTPRNLYLTRNWDEMFTSLKRIIYLVCYTACF